jgi:hypothetical protein
VWPDDHGESRRKLKDFQNAPITMRKPKSDMAHGRAHEQCLQEEDRMSSPITPPQAVQPATVGAPTAPAPSLGAAGPATVAPAVSLDTLPSSPPQEVLDQMASAAQTYEALSAQGRELRFSRDEQSGRTRIEVRDRGGNVLKTISPAQALAVAAGAPLE